MSDSMDSAWNDVTPVRSYAPSSRSHSRRIGTRVATSFSVFVSMGDDRVRVRAAQLSTTGVVLDLRHAALVTKTGTYTLELAVPGLRRPIRCVARLVRHFGKLAAFEFLVIGRDERLTLAEHIDRVGKTWRA